MNKIIYLSSYKISKLYVQTIDSLKIFTSEKHYRGGSPGGVSYHDLMNSLKALIFPDIVVANSNCLTCQPHNEAMNKHSWKTSTAGAPDPIPKQ